MILRVTMLPQNNICLIDNGKVFVFDKGGNCISEDLGLEPKYTNGMTDLPIISILSTSGSAEVALFEHDVMTRYSYEGDSIECVMKLQMQGGFVRMLKHNGKSNNVKYNQMIFVYSAGTRLTDVVSGLKLNKL